MYMTVIEEKDLSELTDRELSVLCGLALKRNGWMAGALKEHFYLQSKADTSAKKRRVKNCRLWVAMDEGRVAGWAIAYEQYLKPSVIIGDVYIDFPYRRQGLGTELVEKMQQAHPNLSVHEWDEQSADFFSSLAVRPGQADFWDAARVDRQPPKIRV